MYFIFYFIYFFFGFGVFDSFIRFYISLSFFLQKIDKYILESEIDASIDPPLILLFALFFFFSLFRWLTIVAVARRLPSPEK